MISIVIVSHSQEIAAGVKRMAEQLCEGEVCVAAVGGVPDDGGSYRLGTDVHRIAKAIREAWNADGVLILMDLGSSVMSAEMAVEMLPPEMAARCLLSNAPLVEGTIVAALHASLGHTLADVNAAAEESRTVDKLGG